MSGARNRSSSRRGTRARTRARTALQRSARRAAAHGKSQPCAAASSSMATIVRRSRPWREAPRAVRRHRDVILLVGRGRDRIDARRIGAAACSRRPAPPPSPAAIMKPELRPGFGVRKAGRPDRVGSISRRSRRSESEPISQIASAMMSAAKATGSAWKLPPESASSVVGEDQRIVRHAVGLDRPASRRPGASDRGRRPSPAAGSAGSRGPARDRRR